MWTVTNIWLSHLFTCLTQNWSTWDIFHRISFKWWSLWIWHLLPFQQIFQKRLNLLKNCLFEKCSDGQSVFKSLLTHELINYTSFLNNKSYLIWQNLTLHFCQLSKKSLIYFWKRDFHLESHFDFFARCPPCSRGLWPKGGSSTTADSFRPLRTRASSLVSLFGLPVH